MFTQHKYSKTVKTSKGLTQNSKWRLPLSGLGDRHTWGLASKLLVKFCFLKQVMDP